MGEKSDLSDLESNHSGKKLDAALDIPEIIKGCYLTSSSYKNTRPFDQISRDRKGCSESQVVQGAVLKAHRLPDPHR